MNDIIIGIDLGTTNSEVAAPIEGRIEIISESGNPILPSCVALDPSGNLLVGEAARNQYVLYPERTVRSIKRRMGSDDRVSLGENTYSPQEISAMILRKLKDRAEKHLGRPVRKAVITVPAQFSDAQRQATRDAGAIAGLEVLRIINEPTAACLAYESDPGIMGKNVLAFDLGGGTFDVSIVHMEGTVVEVITSHGDNHLGGDDIDELIADWLIRRIHERSKDPVRLHPLTGYRLRSSAETAKIHLSDHPHARIIEENLKTETETPVFLDEELHRPDFEELMLPLLNKAMNSVHAALASAGLRPDQIDEIILVGGSTRIPALQGMLEKALGKKPRTDIHPDLAVAYGAGVMAARLMGEMNQRVLIDITPYTFGTSTLGMLNGLPADYCFFPLIKAGTPLPVTKAESFATVVDEQEAVDLRIFQGDNRDARKNILIGRFMVEGLSKVPAPNEIVISMNLDLNGILKVSAMEKSTGLNKQITIEDATAKLTEEDIQKARAAVNDLFGRESGFVSNDFEEDDGADAEVTAGYTEQLAELTDRVDGCREKMDLSDLKEVEDLLARLKAAADADDDETFNDIATQIDDLLFYVEVD